MKVFIDASVLLAGLKSSTGGSRIILLLAGKRKVASVVSLLVLEEVKRNISKKFSEKELSRLATWLKKARPYIVSLSEKEISLYEKFVSSKDAHVLAAADKAKSKFLVTLDKKHLLKIRKDTKFSFEIVTPGELISLL